MADLARVETVVRRTGRSLGIAIAVVAMMFAIGESVVPAEGATDWRWLDVVALALMALGIAGLLAAWWWPIHGGILAIVGVLLPTWQTLSFGQVPYPFLVVMLVGALHVWDGWLRQRGIGPPIGHPARTPRAT